MAFQPDPDELAGVADLFGGLTREELGDALVELAFKRGEDVDAGAFDGAIRTAVRDYYLLAVPHDGELVLVPGPVAFPALPEGAADLPHILDVPDRSVPPDALAERVRERLASDAESAVEEGDGDRAADLLEVSYDAETWASVELDGVREQLDAVV